MEPRVLFAPRQPVPPGPDVAGDLPRYRAWATERQDRRLAAGRALPTTGDDLDVLLVVDRPRPDLLRRCLRGLAAQTCEAWSLVVATPAGLPGAAPTAADAVPAGEVEATLRRELGDPARWSWVGTADGTRRDRAAAVQLAFDHSGAPLVTLLGQHDELAPDAVALLRYAMEDVDFAYGDEDALDADGGATAPLLKPGWSPELLLSHPYVGRPWALRRELVAVCGGFRAEVGGVRSEVGGDWEHDLLLRASERASAVAHVAEVLVHRGADALPHSGYAPIRAALARRAEKGAVEQGPVVGTHRVHRRAEPPCSVTLVIPFRDQPRFLRNCVDSVTATAGSVAVELLLVDNGSEDPEALSLAERLAERRDVTVLRDPRPFNWAALNNAAVTRAKGDVLLFLNDDVEARGEGWLASLAAQAQRPDVAAVGARLLYPSGSVQHAGMVVGMGGAAGHLLLGLASDDPGYLGLAVLAREVTAVTGACLATRRAVFDELGGFDESLGLDLNDADYCLRARARGYRVLYEPGAELVHHESPSRGTSGSAGDIRRFVERWEQEIREGDPYLSPHLSRVSSGCSLAGPDEEGWWREWHATLPTP